MIKHYCDVCGKELDRNYVSDRLIRTMGKVKTEVMVSIDGAWNHGDICLVCLMNVLTAGKVDPKWDKANEAETKWVSCSEVNASTYNAELRDWRSKER